MVLVNMGVPSHTPSLISSISKDNRSFQDILQTGLAKSRGVKGKEKPKPGQNRM